MLPAMGDTLLIDSGFVQGTSVEVAGYNVAVDYVVVGNRLAWITTTPKDSISVSYRVLDFRMSYYNKNTAIVYDIYEENPFKYTPTNRAIASSYGSLNTMGNVSRGIGFGNAQDVVVNSNLNLRLSGKLDNDIEVLAVISDENNPIQPEGNTQQIQDFDQVYITLKKDSASLTLGDFLMKRPSDSYFINYYKRSRGLQYQQVNWLKDWRISTQAEAAISRGRFSRNRIDGLEGNSGPYRLQGDNGEIFIIVIAGTEKVFLDGKELIRGEGNDYVINYNTGEVSFTPRILITRYSRILVEFQYSDRNYGRSVAHLGTSISKGRFTIYANGFNEMDLKSQPNTGVDDDSLSAKIDVLIAAGDAAAIFQNVKSQDVFDTDRIMYTIENIGGIETYKYAALPQDGETYYLVVFSNLGSGSGGYNQAETAANGKVFEYVGEGFGSYAPIEVLIAPKKLNSLNIGFNVKRKGGITGLEYAVSQYDENTFSSIDDEDNSGFGLKLYQTTNRSLKDSSPWKLKTDLNYELVSGQYNYIERYRAVEFDRQWNKVISNPNALAQLVPSYEHIANATVSLEKSAATYFINRASLFSRPGNFIGLSNTASLGFLLNKTSFSSSLELLNTDTDEGDTTTLANSFYSVSAQVARPLGSLVAGLGYTNEQSAFSRDTLLIQSYSFQSYNAYIEQADTGRLRYRINAAQRIDQLPKNDGFATSTVGRDIGFRGSYTSKKSQRIDLSSIYRRLSIEDTTLSSKPVENTLQSRVELDFNFLKKFIRSRTFYQLGTGQEQRREFQYLAVQPGNGVYVWNDYDTNGLKTLNEFEAASDLDRQRADYIKVFTPVAGLITTNSNKISQTLEFNPAVFYKPTGKSSKPLYARFNSLSTLLLDKKILPTSIVDFLNPSQRELTDTSLINSSQSWRTTLFYNRGNPKYSIDYTYLSSQSKVLLSNGFDSRSSNDNVLNTRVNLGKILTLDTRLVAGERTYLSEFFTQNNYQYAFYELEPKFQFVIQNTYRLELKARYFTAANSQEYGGESTVNTEVGSEFKYTKAGKGALNAGVSYIKVNYTGLPGTNLGYELLRGLQNGNNTTWKTGYQRTLANNVQVIISYEGRKSEDADVIHIGRLLARYLF
jgi:hypothetical protein